MRGADRRQAFLSSDTAARARARYTAPFFGPNGRYAQGRSAVSMNTTAAAIQAPTLEIRFGQVSLPQVRIRTTDPGAILDELTGRVASAPRFFERTAVCLDLSALEKEPDAAEVRA